MSRLSLNDNATPLSGLVIRPSSYKTIGSSAVPIATIREPRVTWRNDTREAIKAIGTIDLDPCSFGDR